jgi:molecular chaperone GrpE
MSQKIEIQDDQAQDPAVMLSSDQIPDETTYPESQPTGEMPNPSTENEDLTQRLEVAEQSARDSYDRLLRVSAEFDNYKKRSSREMRDVAKFATEKLVGDLLVVVDNLERAVASAAGDRADDPLVQGVTMTLNEVMKLLERQNVTPIDALGKPFNPAVHQAMLTEVSADFPPNTVVRELQKGYLIHDRLLRPTMVTVSAAAGATSFNQTDC